MATMDAFTKHDHTASDESLADRGLPFAGMGGAGFGALAGTVFGVELGSNYPVVFGTLGTVLGSACVAMGWVIVAGLFAESETHRERSEPINSASSAK